MTKSHFLAMIAAGALVISSTAYAQDQDDCDDDESTQTTDDDCPGVILPPANGAGIFTGLGAGLAGAGALAPALGGLLVIGGVAAASSNGSGGSAVQTNGLSGF